MAWMHLSNPAKTFLHVGQISGTIPSSRSKTPMALPDNGLFGAIAGKNPYLQLKLHRLAAANDRLRVAEPRALCDARAGGDIAVNAVPDLNTTTPIAGPVQTTLPAAPQRKLV